MSGSRLAAYASFRKIRDFSDIGLDAAHPFGDFGLHPQRVGYSGDEIERDHHTHRVEILPRREGSGIRDPDVLRRLRRLAEDMADAGIETDTLSMGMSADAEAGGSTPEEYASYVAAEQKRWGEVVRKAGVKVN